VAIAVPTGLSHSHREEEKIEGVQRKELQPRWKKKRWRRRKRSFIEIQKKGILILFTYTMGVQNVELPLLDIHLRPIIISPTVPPELG